MPQKAFLHQRDLFVYTATADFQKPLAGTPHIQCPLSSFPDSLLSVFSGNMQEGTNEFLLGIFWSKLPAFTPCIHCTVRSPAFRICQNYCVSIAVLLNTFQNARAYEHAQSFCKCKLRLEQLGTHSSVQLRNFLCSLVYLHFAYVEKVKQIVVLLIINLGQNQNWYFYLHKINTQKKTIQKMLRAECTARPIAYQRYIVSAGILVYMWTCLLTWP